MKKIINKIHNVHGIFYNNLYMLKIVKKVSLVYIIVSILISISALIDTFSNTLFSKIVFDSMGGARAFSELLLIVGLLFLLMVLSSAFQSWYYQKYSVIIDTRIKEYVRTMLFKKIGELDISCFETPKFYDQYTRALSEADGRAIAVIKTISRLAYYSISIITLFTIIIYLDSSIFIFSLFGAITSALISKKIAKLRYEYDYEKTGLDRRISYIGRVLYEPQYAKEFKIDSMLEYFIGSYKKLIGNLLVYQKNKMDQLFKWDLISSLHNVAMQLLLTLFLTYKVYNGMLSIGDYAALLNCAFTLMYHLRTITSIFPELYQHGLFIQNLRKVLDYQSTIEVDKGIVLDSNVPITFEFINVHFSYPGSDIEILKGVNMIFNSNTKNAIVGKNAAGKTTIVKLIMRLYDVTEGQILLNGIDIREYNVFSLRKQISTVFQDYQEYSVPICDYISCGDCYNENNDEKLIASLKKVGIYSKIKKLVNGTKTTITKEFDDKGVVFSGGESQRLAIAKAIYKGGGVLVMDEPSASLDPIHEDEINKLLFELSSHKTMIVISHRLSLTQDADEIFLLEDGIVKEFGTHSHLMKLQGSYAKMYEIQSKKYK